MPIVQHLAAACQSRHAQKSETSLSSLPSVRADRYSWEASALGDETVESRPGPANEPSTDDVSCLPAASTCPTFALVLHAAAQEVKHTASRRIRHASDWMDAVRWMVQERFHPSANATTLRVAADIASRMHHSSHGHVAYNRRAMTERLALSARCISEHVQYLRQLGLLAFVEHGSRRNSLRTRLGADYRRGMGYRGTATIYAPVAPRAWDVARGHRIAGAGYAARLSGVTETGRRRAVETARARARQRQTDHSRHAACTPSVGYPSHSSTGAGSEWLEKNTALPRVSGSRCRLAKPASALRPALSEPSPMAHRRTATKVAASMDVAAWVRPRVNWTQAATLRRLAYALRPLLDQGLTREDIAALLTSWSWSWGGTWRPKDPVGYLIQQGVRGRFDVQVSSPDAAVATSCDCGCEGPASSVTANAEFRAVMAALRTSGPQAVPDPDRLPKTVEGDRTAETAWRASQAREIRQMILASLHSAAVAADARQRATLDFGQWEAAAEAHHRATWSRPSPVAFRAPDGPISAAVRG